MPILESKLPPSSAPAVNCPTFCEAFTSSCTGFVVNVNVLELFQLSKVTAGPLSSKSI